MRIRQTIFVVPLMLAACVEPYLPPSQSQGINLLVVDGFVNGTSKSATVKLTRAVPLSISVPNPPETGATVSVENEEGTTFLLSETSDGVYQANNLAIDPLSEYRVRIHTKNGSEYTSDYVVMRAAPVLDSVSWKPEATGTRFYVSGHDPSGSTTYYRYLYTETWEYRSVYYSYWKYVSGVPIFRKEAEQVYTCWKTGQSTEILTTSTRRLSEDVVSMFPIGFVNKGSRMLSRWYSINVQQRAISKEEYEYWDLIRKTTESLGGLFDPLPSQVVGNVHNVDNDDEQVLGYFSGSYVSEKRIYVSVQDLPGYLQHADPYDFECSLYFVPLDKPWLVENGVFVELVGNPPTGWTASSRNCADCTALGGSNTKPDFWDPK